MLITQGPTPPSTFLHRTSIYLGGVNCNINSYASSIIKRNPSTSSSSIISRNLLSRCKLAVTGLLAAAAVISYAAVGAAAIEAPPQPETLSNIPQTLSGECASPKDCKKARIQRPKSRKAESCTIKCVTTCIRGGEGSPGEGPFNVRRPLVVFKQGFRSRQYCLVECSDICNLIGDGDDGP
ncbi:hypothetical protein I3760_01G085800 [Carya illinoinensis]|uniref:Uncharacterized protein n=1 Tax=Carya illinoinensis TaxID=32201 RepID=A0A922K3H4_CARIL|nr:hypothetical protein I3760_01G085800 [Carya illinoinensis]KAG6730596.1 hypothetical protein I3842_01G088800 [Carya illinoinensis]